jgi:nitroreductase
MTHKAPFRPLDFKRLSAEEMKTRSIDWLEELSSRRSVRHFSSDPIPLDVVERCIAAAGTAPSGAHKQPWTFVLVTDPDLKRRIREGAEKEEQDFYSRRASEQWLRDLRPLDTDAHKPMLEDAPALIVVFAQSDGRESGERHYYVQESVGISVGFLLASLHHAGLVSLTHTPSPMRFLRELLDRPRSERPFLLIPVGYPAEDCEIPDLERKALAEILIKR